MEIHDPSRVATVTYVLGKAAPLLEIGDYVRLGMEGDPCNTYRGTEENLKGIVTHVAKNADGTYELTAGFPDGGVMILNSYDVRPDRVWERIEPSEFGAATDAMDAMGAMGVEQKVLLAEESVAQPAAQKPDSLAVSPLLNDLMDQVAALRADQQIVKSENETLRASFQQFVKLYNKRNARDKYLFGVFARSINLAACNIQSQNTMNMEETFNKYFDDVDFDAFVVENNAVARGSDEPSRAEGDEPSKAEGDEPSKAGGDEPSKAGGDDTSRRFGGLSDKFFDTEEDARANEQREKEGERDDHERRFGADES